MFYTTVNCYAAVHPQLPALQLIEWRIRLLTVPITSLSHQMDNESHRNAYTLFNEKLIYQNHANFVITKPYAVFTFGAFYHRALELYSV